MPVRRKRRRYLSVEADCTKALTAKEMVDTIQRGVIGLCGVAGLSTVEPSLIEFDEESQRGILRCNRERVRTLRAALALITDVSGTPAAIRVTGVSGTIRSLRRRGPAEGP